MFIYDMKHFSYEGRDFLAYRREGCGDLISVWKEPGPFQGHPVRRKEEDALSKLN